jgi:hypothetical protein
MPEFVATQRESVTESLPMLSIRSCRNGPSIRPDLRAGRVHSTIRNHVPPVPAFNDQEPALAESARALAFRECERPDLDGGTGFR